MRSLRLQLSLLFSVSATAILLVLFVIGYQLLEHHLETELDRLIVGHFGEVKARLGPDSASLDSPTLDQRLRETTDFASGLFYIEVDVPGTPIRFRSHNLEGRSIPDVSGMRRFNVSLGGIGALRVHEFLLDRLDVLIAMERAPLERTMMSYNQACLVLLGVMFFTSVGVAMVLGTIVLQPIRSISQTAHRIGHDNLSERIVVARVHDEINDLALLLNEMFDRLEVGFHQARRFADDASHELKTPLTLIRLHAEKMLRMRGLTADQEEALVEQLAEVSRLNRIVEDLLFLSRAKAGVIKRDRTPHDAAGLLAGFEQDAVVLAEHHGCRFELNHSGAGTVDISAKWVRQILLNLLTNALHVSPGGSLVRLGSSIADQRWTLILDDEGPGLDREQRERMFERFVRYPNGKSGGEHGAGLGLAICRSITELHGGRIYAAPAPSGGLRMVVEMPLAPAG